MGSSFRSHLRVKLTFLWTNDFCLYPPFLLSSCSRDSLTLKNLRCFLKRYCLRGVILSPPPPPPPTNSKTKDASTTKLCTVIVRHRSTKNQQLIYFQIFLFYCLQLLFYCVLDHKKWVKMVKFQMLPMKMTLTG